MDQVNQLNKLIVVGEKELSQKHGKIIKIQKMSIFGNLRTNDNLAMPIVVTAVIKTK